jgi:hypothetical protein
MGPGRTIGACALDYVSLPNAPLFRCADSVPAKAGKVVPNVMISAIPDQLTLRSANLTDILPPLAVELGDINRDVR